MILIVITLFILYHRKVNAESLYAPRDQPEKESKREKERKTRGNQAFMETGPGPSLYFSGKLLYLDLYIEGDERCKVVESQPKHYIPTRIFFLHAFPINNVVYIIFWP